MKRVAALIVVLGGLAGLLYGIKLYIRYSWPKSVAWMRDLPPADRSTWVTPPVAWTNRSLELEVATPTGYRRTNIVYRVNGLGMALIRVEPGTFWCGLPERQMRQLGWKKETRHQVTLTRPYYLGAYEVTNVEFERFAPAHRARRPSYQRSPAGDLHPAQPVTWAQAQEFCRWLSAREGRAYRLPTEAEWEYACRAGSQARTYWGDDFWDRNKANTMGLKSVRESWCEDGFRFTSPVGVFPPNPWGFYDIIGNAREWVNDWYENYTTNAVVDPLGPPDRGHYRVIKGAGWMTQCRFVTCSCRDGNNPADVHDVVGFRVLCEVADTDPADRDP